LEVVVKAICPLNVCSGMSMVRLQCGLLLQEFWTSY